MVAMCFFLGFCISNHTMVIGVARSLGGFSLKALPRFSSSAVPFLRHFIPVNNTIIHRLVGFFSGITGKHVSLPHPSLPPP